MYALCKGDTAAEAVAVPPLRAVRAPDADTAVRAAVRLAAVFTSLEPCSLLAVAVAAAAAVVVVVVSGGGNIKCPLNG